MRCISTRDRPADDFRIRHSHRGRGERRATGLPGRALHGPLRPTRNEPARHHIVRVGWDTSTLPDEAHVDIWALAHGLPARLDSTRWTRRAIVSAAADAGTPDAPAILGNLAELGLIVEVSPGTEQAREFASSYRLHSLMIGLGNSPAEPDFDAIGFAGSPPMATVTPRVFEIWQWAHLWPTLWAACEGLAFVAGETETGNAEDSDPERVLDLVIEAMRMLISRSAAYLDVATSPPGGTGSAP